MCIPGESPDYSDENYDALKLLFDAQDLEVNPALPIAPMDLVFDIAGVASISPGTSSVVTSLGDSSKQSLTVLQQMIDQTAQEPSADVSGLRILERASQTRSESVSSSETSLHEEEASPTSKATRRSCTSTMGSPTSRLTHSGDYPLLSALVDLEPNLEYLRKAWDARELANPEEGFVNMDDHCHPLSLLNEIAQEEDYPFVRIVHCVGEGDLEEATRIYEAQVESAAKEGQPNTEKSQDGEERREGDQDEEERREEVENTDGEVERKDEGEERRESMSEDSNEEMKESHEDAEQREDTERTEVEVGTEASPVGATQEVHSKAHGIEFLASISPPECSLVRKVSGLLSSKVELHTGEENVEKTFRNMDSNHGVRFLASISPLECSLVQKVSKLWTPEPAASDDAPLATQASPKRVRMNLEPETKVFEKLPTFHEGGDDTTDNHSRDSSCKAIDILMDAAKSQPEAASVLSDALRDWPWHHGTQDSKTCAESVGKLVLWDGVEVDGVEDRAVPETRIDDFVDAPLHTSEKSDKATVETAQEVHSKDSGIKLLASISPAECSLVSKVMHIGLVVEGKVEENPGRITLWDGVEVDGVANAMEAKEDVVEGEVNDTNDTDTTSISQKDMLGENIVSGTDGDELGPVMLFDGVMVHAKEHRGQEDAEDEVVAENGSTRDEAESEDGDSSGLIVLWDGVEVDGVDNVGKGVEEEGEEVGEGKEGTGNPIEESAEINTAELEVETKHGAEGETEDVVEVAKIDQQESREVDATEQEVTKTDRAQSIDMLSSASSQARQGFCNSLALVKLASQRSSESQGPTIVQGTQNLNLVFSVSANDAAGDSGSPEMLEEENTSPEDMANEPEPEPEEPMPPKVPSIDFASKFVPRDWDDALDLFPTVPPTHPALMEGIAKLQRQLESMPDLSYLSVSALEDMAPELWSDVAAEYLDWCEETMAHYRSQKEVEILSEALYMAYDVAKAREIFESLRVEESKKMEELEAKVKALEMELSSNRTPRDPKASTGQAQQESSSRNYDLAHLSQGNGNYDLSDGNITVPIPSGHLLPIKGHAYGPPQHSPSAPKQQPTKASPSRHMLSNPPPGLAPAPYNPTAPVLYPNGGILPKDLIPSNPYPTPSNPNPSPSKQYPYPTPSNPNPSSSKQYTHPNLPYRRELPDPVVYQRDVEPRHYAPPEEMAWAASGPRQGGGKLRALRKLPDHGIAPLPKRPLPYDPYNDPLDPLRQPAIKKTLNPISEHTGPHPAYVPNPRHGPHPSGLNPRHTSSEPSYFAPPQGSRPMLAGMAPGNLDPASTYSHPPAQYPSALGPLPPRALEINYSNPNQTRQRGLSPTRTSILAPRRPFMAPSPSNTQQYPPIPPANTSKGGQIMRV